MLAAKTSATVLPHTFYGLTPGTRVVWYSVSSDSDGTTIAYTRRVTIRSGANILHVVLL